jgi:acetylornithine deacetylase/succinyl-diaminopimelate desuccinylase-like protein
VSDRVREAVQQALPEVRAELERLIRVPSVSAPGFDPAEVGRSAEVTAEILSAAGLADVRLLDEGETFPAVLATHPAPDGAPTVVLYAHHDVQPPGDEADWESPPFEPVERDGRLFGRGSADDKGGIAVHAAALRAFAGTPPVGVTVFVEGEEEIGSPNLTAFLERHRDELAGDIIILADSTNWRVGQPGITSSLRGLVDCEVEVRTLDHGVHSGFLGGVFPDALTVLCRLLATLHDDRGRVAIPGLVSGDADPLDLTEAELRQQVGAVPGLQEIGEGNLTARLWRRPHVSVLAIDAPRVSEASNTLIPSARAKVSLRLAPGDDPQRAMDALVEHLESNTPWGAEVRVHRGAAARPFAVDTEGPAFEAAEAAFEEAWGRAPLYIGQGGTIPFVADFADAYPQAAILLTGVCDPDSRMHGANESVALSELENACLAEAFLLERLAPG